MSALPIKVRPDSAGAWAIKIAWVLGIVAFLLYIPTKTATGTIGDMTKAFELAIAAMALNLVMGFGGIISLGHSAFFALGGYTTAVLVSEYGWSQGWTIYIAALVAFVAGCLVALPTLRLSGVYLALVTLGVAVLFPAIIRWKKLEWLTDGARGISGIQYKEFPKLPFVGDEGPRDGRAVYMYWLTVFILILAYLVCRGIVKSRVGRSLVAIRDNQTAAAVMGVNVARTKLLVFGVSAALCAVGGSLFAVRTNVVNVVDIPMFTLVGSIIFLVLMVLGGAGTLWGPIVGAVIYIYLDNTSRSWGASGTGPLNWLFGWMTGSPATLILSVVLLVMMFVAPYGIVGLLRRFAAKFVVLLPRPAGTGVGSTVPPAADTTVDDSGGAVDPFDSISTGGDLDAS